ncbi:MAG: NHL repeat-containing protein [Chloroflexota bacterium]|nr:NHL repeat-containing protein [Chloroflexota bacterium]
MIHPDVVSPAGPVRQADGLDACPVASLHRVPWLGAFWVAFAVGIALRTLLVGGRGPLTAEEAGYALDAWRLLTGHAAPAESYRAAPGYVQTLSLWMFGLGTNDVTPRVLSTAAGMLSVLFCLPLSRVIGRGAALLAALLLAVSPYWLLLDARGGPDPVAVCLALFGASLTVTRHWWPWSLAGAGAAAGFLLSFGAPGLWLSAGLVVFVATTARRAWRPQRVAYMLLSFGSAAAVGLTAFFTRAPQLPQTASSTAPVSFAAWIREVGLSAPVWALAIGLVGFVIAFGRERRPLPPAEILAGLGAVVLVLAQALPAGYRPPPSTMVLLAIFAAAWLLDRSLRTLRPGAPVVTASAVVLALMAISAVIGWDRKPILYAPGGAVAPSAPPAGVRAAFGRVRRVSAELYVLQRSLAEPRGGRGLKVEVAPELAVWGLWYLRDFEDVRVGQQAGGRAEVLALTASSLQATPGPNAERFGEVTLSWNARTWRQISPVAGATEPGLKPRYDLFDRAPPGDRPGQLNSPVDLALDPVGNYFVVDQANARVQKYAPNGRFLKQWGSRGAGEGQFAYTGATLGPTGIAATARYVWVADTWNHRIQQFTTDGEFVRAWGTFVDTTGDPKLGAQSPRAFYGPRGLAVGPGGLLYVTDTGNKRVVVYDQSGRYVRQWGEAGDGISQLDEPIGIAVDRRNTVYVADTRNARVQVYDARGKHQRSWSVTTWEDEGRLEPYLDTDRAGNVYVTDPITKSLQKYSPVGALLAETDGNAESSLLEPLGVAVSPRGNQVFVVDAALGNVLNLGVVR